MKNKNFDTGGIIPNTEYNCIDPFTNTMPLMGCYTGENDKEAIIDLRDRKINITVEKTGGSLGVKING